MFVRPGDSRAIAVVKCEKDGTTLIIFVESGEATVLQPGEMFTLVMDVDKR